MTKTLIPRADVRRACGNRIIMGFFGTSMTAELRALIREVSPLGVILFARNVESPEQVSELNSELKSLRPHEPLLCSVDQEGGRVARVGAPATAWPPLRAVGRQKDAALARELGRALATELRAMSFDVNYAPVLDVDTNPQNPVIGDRSFGRDAALVAELGAAFIKGHEGAGVGACGKHFPGHGDTDTDSHLELPAVHHDLERLRRVEWPPFRAAVGAGVGAIMTAHVVASALDHEAPATLSREVLSRLREELGFDGVIISDDLEMKAIAGRFTTADVAHTGVNAGVDVFLVCKTPELIVELYRDLVHAAESGAISHEALLATERRTALWRQRFVRPPVPWVKAKHDVGALAHLELSRRLEA